MLMRTIIAFGVILSLGTGNAWATAHKPTKHRHAHPVRTEAILPPPYYGGTLVLHPASNIACNTPFRSSRALPCDQPVWVYGSPCEIDLGLGRYRSCE
jgi:hypothetical protein